MAVAAGRSGNAAPASTCARVLRRPCAPDSSLPNPDSSLFRLFRREIARLTVDFVEKESPPCTASASCCQSCSSPSRA
jgi:hypothetical protein